MLTAAEKTVVANYIATVPALVTLRNQARDGEIAHTLNSRVLDGVRSITRFEALKWAGVSGRFAKIKDASVLGTNSVAIRSRCLVMLEIISEGLDATDTGVINLIDALITDGVLAAGDKTAFLAAAADKVSKSYELLKRHITADEVGTCR